MSSSIKIAEHRSTCPAVTCPAVNTEHNELTLEEAWAKRMEYNRQHKMLPKTQLQIKACRHGHIDSLFGVHTVGPHTADMQYAGSTMY